MPERPAPSNSPSLGESPARPDFGLGEAASLACALEATAPKPGNVHRGADFEDLCFPDFVTSAVAIGPLIEQTPQRGVGQTVYEIVHRTQALVGTNTNLGIALLLAPLAAVPRPIRLAEGIGDVLSRLHGEDSHWVYRAIALAAPGGLQTSDQHDIAGPPPDNLLDAMRHAQDRDLIARQYANQFRELLHQVLPWLVEARRRWALTEAIIHTHVRTMAAFPDSLIGRKCGSDVAGESAARADAVLQAGTPGEPAYYDALAELDFWLRSAGKRRNPGTTADLIAAALFAALREGQLAPPYR